MFKVRFGWFGRVMASCLVAFNLLSGVGFCTHDNCTEIRAIDKISDLNAVLRDQGKFYEICRYIVKSSEEIPVDKIKFICLLENIGNGNLISGNSVLKLKARMYKEITTTLYPKKESEESKKPEKPEKSEKLEESEELKKQQEKQQEKRSYYPLVVTNVWTIKQRFYFQSKLCKDAITLINGFRKVDPKKFSREIDLCTDIFDRNIKKIELLKNISFLLDADLFPLVNKKWEFLKNHFPEIKPKDAVESEAQVEKLI